MPDIISHCVAPLVRCSKVSRHPSTSNALHWRHWSTSNRTRIFTARAIREESKNTNFIINDLCFIHATVAMVTGVRAIEVNHFLRWAVAFSFYEKFVKLHAWYLYRRDASRKNTRQLEIWLETWKLRKSTGAILIFFEKEDKIPLIQNGGTHASPSCQQLIAARNILNLPLCSHREPVAIIWYQFALALGWKLKVLCKHKRRRDCAAGRSYHPTNSWFFSNSVSVRRGRIFDELPIHKARRLFKLYLFTDRCGCYIYKYNTAVSCDSVGNMVRKDATKEFLNIIKDSALQGTTIVNTQYNKENNKLKG